MTDQKLVRDVFLCCMASIYMFAFTSLYFQIPGLYGDDGLLPAKNVLKPDSRLSSYENFLNQPTLLWFAKDIGLTTQTAMELLCLLGTLFSFMAIVSNNRRDFGTFFILWFFYFSLYQVGQTFLQFQWDILLLESGFLCLVVAMARKTSSQASSPFTSISLWLVKWLLFRLMFASCVVKLTSGCPTWWGLTALNWHYESQCIPTSLAWYAHQLPDWFQKFSVVMTYVIEGSIPFLFFAPLRSLRIVSFYFQVLLQILIIFTGNYNFFNLLTLTLCLSLLDDQHLVAIFPWMTKNGENCEEPSHGTTTAANRSWTRRILNVFKKLLFCFVMFVLFYWTKRLFLMKINGSDIIYSKVDFTYDDFSDALSKVVPISIWLGAVSFLVEIVLSFIQCLRQPKVSSKVFSILQWLVVVSTAIWLFSISLVPYTSINRESQQNLWPVVHRWYQRADNYQIANSYGLFRRMTGVGGRPEVIIEGSRDINGPWKEYNFVYKPGSLKRRPPFLMPHQPRLDWQMWFAALGAYQHNPWFVHLVYKLLHGEKVVLDLMEKNQPFTKPPQYIRASLYMYHYTRLQKNTTSFRDLVHNTKLIKSWWRREFSSEYLPPVSKAETTLQQFLDHFQLGKSAGKVSSPPTSVLGHVITYLRSKINGVDPFLSITTVFTVALCLNFICSASDRLRRRNKVKYHSD